MLQYLSDEETYTKLNSRKIPLETTKKHKNNTWVNYLYKNKYISIKDKNCLISRHAVPSRIYGLIKTHKQNYPIRPVVSTVLSALTNLNKYLADILSNLLHQSKFNIQNSSDLKEKLTSLKVENDEQLFSLDVVSLFTNVPVDLAIQSVMKR